VGINPSRRIQRDLLDVPRQSTAWWFSERADCDELPALLGGASSPHVDTCEQCQSDLRRSSDLRGGEGHLTSEDLWDLDLGSMPPLRRRAAEAHLAACTACNVAAQALAEGNRAIAELDAPASSPSIDTVDTVEVVGESPRFRVLLQRRMRVLTVVGRKGLPRSVRVNTGAGFKTAALQRGEWVVELEPREMGRLVELEVEIEEGREPEQLHVKT
jgi:hypothetical protein